MLTQLHDHLGFAFAFNSFSIIFFHVAAFVREAFLMKYADISSLKKVKDLMSAMKFYIVFQN
jgi:hypothetical protein